MSNYTIVTGLGVNPSPITTCELSLDQILNACQQVAGSFNDATALLIGMNTAFVLVYIFKKEIVKDLAPEVIATNLAINIIMLYFLIKMG